MFSLGTDKQVREKHANECALTSGGGPVQEEQGTAGNVLLSPEKQDSKTQFRPTALNLSGCSF